MNKVQARPLVAVDGIYDTCKLSHKLKLKSEKWFSLGVGAYVRNAQRKEQYKIKYRINQIQVKMNCLVINNQTFRKMFLF